MSMPQLVLLAMLVCACASERTPTVRPAPAPTLTAAATASAETNQVLDATAPSTASADAGLAPLVDPAKIVGYVSGRIGPEFVGKAEGELTEVALTPRDEHIAELRFAVTDAQRQAHRFVFTAPRALPLPMKLGQSVRFRANARGGGPNRRVGILLTAMDGALLFAVNFKPDDWQVERGRRAKTKPAGHGGNPEHEHDVDFARGDAKISVGPGEWALFDAGGASYYLWAHSVVRQLPPRAMAPPDYVGGWLDFAIVRAR